MRTNPILKKLPVYMDRFINRR